MGAKFPQLLYRNLSPLSIVISGRVPDPNRGNDLSELDVRLSAEVIKFQADFERLFKSHSQFRPQSKVNRK